MSQAEAHDAAAGEGKNPEPVSAEPVDPAVRAARNANKLAAAALIVSALSALFTAEQAQQAKRANDDLQLTKARNVYLDIPQAGPAGQRINSINNRNKEPVTQVYYTYRVDGADEPVRVLVGSLQGCSSARLTPVTGDDQQPSFRPLSVYYTDPSGRSWRRDAGLDPVQVDSPEGLPESPESSGSTAHIDDC
jgi:hypothetical protein